MVAGNRPSSFGLPPGQPLDHRHGGRLSSTTGELSIHGMGDDYTVEGNGTIKSLPTMPVGATAFLKILGTPTFTNSTKLICQGGRDYIASPGDIVIARSDGDGVWRIYVLPATGSNLRVSGIQNGKIVESHASNAATFALKTLNGVDPSLVDPVLLVFPDGTTGSVTAALSLTISSGSTLGASNATPFRVWHALVNDAGTIRFASRKCSDANGIYGFPATGIISSTAEGGVGTANSSGVTYTGVAVSSKPCLILGYCDYNSGLTTAGTWAASPSSITVYAPGMPKPGDIAQSKQFSSFTLLTNGTASYVDSSLTVSITPSSACNLVDTSWIGNMQVDTAGIAGFAALRRAGTVIGNINKFFSVSGNGAAAVGGSWMDSPGSAGSITYTVATKLSSASGNCYFCNSDSGATIKVAEIMG